MVRANAPRPTRPVTPAAVAKLERALDAYADKLTRLEHEFEIHVRRMAAMQAEIDHLKATQRRD